MFKEISKHPSDIAESAVEYLKSVEVSEKTKKFIARFYIYSYRDFFLTLQP